MTLQTGAKTMIQNVQLPIHNEQPIEIYQSYSQRHKIKYKPYVLSCKKDHS